ncbi:hypothetical protein EIP91_005124 [Steccherinum ochraceum]|uniref:Transcription factor CBF/NF-Y/archaeal histone domain-containing protein n=1 Tax=Steccherinum ochraceum TaxID=92696 RepID=A0A4R0R7P4_9APHY|nr:hypothetical protein EIP91_005124 [Steccherinum ochraceum]
MDFLHPGITQPTFRSLSSSASVESEMDDEEVDQLDSDTEDELPPPAAQQAASSASSAAPAAKPPAKTRPKVPVERVPGKSMIPLSRIESLLEADGEDSFMSKEAVFILAAATEEFVKRLMGAGHRAAQANRRAMVNYRDVATATHQHQEFKFLQDTVPQPISLAEALQRRAAKEKEILEEPAVISAIPSVAPSIAASDSPSATPDILPPSRSRGRGKQQAQAHANGEANGESASTASEPAKRSRRSRKKQSDEQVSAPGPVKEPPPPTHSHRTRRSSRSQRAVDLVEFVESHPSHTNGHSASTNGRSASHRSSRSSSEWGTSMPPPPQTAEPMNVDDYDEREPYPPSAEYQREEVWPPAGHFTGPASGYLEDHRVMFNGRNGMGGGNPGRTIYNTLRPPNR